MSARVTRQAIDVMGKGAGKLRVTRQMIEVLSAQTVGLAASNTLALEQYANPYARVTQQEIDVLGDGSGTARVTQQLVEVLGDDSVDINGIGVNVLSLIVGATASVDRFGIAENILDLEDGVFNGVQVEVGNELGLVTETTGYNSTHHADADSSIGLESEAIGHNPNIRVSASNDIDLVHDGLGRNSVIRISADNAIAFIQESPFRDHPESVISDLSTLDCFAIGAPSGVEHVTSVLALSQTVRHNFVYVAAASAIAMNQGPYIGQKYTKVASVPLSLVNAGSATRLPGVVVVESVLAFEQEATGDTDIISRSRTSVLELTQTATANRDIPVNGDFNFQSTLQLEQSVTAAAPRFVSASTVLPLSNEVRFSQNARVSIVDLLSLDSRCGLVKERSATNVLELLQKAVRIVTASSILNLQQTLDVNRVKAGSSTFVLTQTLARVLEAKRTVVQPLDLSVSANGFIIAAGLFCAYKPFIGSGPGQAPAVTPPMLGYAKLSLTYPLISPTLTVVLRNPQFGNQDRLAFDRVNRETRGGTLDMFADPDWPKQTTLNVNVTALRRQQVENLLAFFQASIGQEIGLLDHENRQWRGIIITPDASVEQEGKDRFTVNFEFEGALA